MSPEIMSDREAFLANGGRIPDELTCRACHRDEAFDYRTRRPLVHRYNNYSDRYR